MARKFRIPTWVYVALGMIVVVYAITALVPMKTVMNMGCPGTQVYCPGVGCVSGQDKCFPGAPGGANKVFSKETFVTGKCPDGTRTDGPCLMEF